MHSDMTSATALGSSYLIAARRTALGRPGGLHRSRRLEDLTAPIVLAALQDAKLAPKAVEEIILGNTTAGGNPARMVGLATGLRESVPAFTVDRQCASGLDAILLAMRAVALGEADVIVAGGAESISTAPWRVAKPKNLFQTPRFIELDQDDADTADASQTVTASEELARRLGITRDQQDAYALHSFLKAETAQAERRFVGEIVPLKMAGAEARDEHSVTPEIDDLAALAPLVPPNGTLTSGNTSAIQDGAAMAVIVSERKHRELGAPRGLRLVASATEGVGPGEDARAPVAALEKLLKTSNGILAGRLGLVEVSEASAAQALALRNAFELDDSQLNPDGGAVARGYPLGASSAVSVVRLFTGLVRGAVRPKQPYGAVTQGAVGGLGVAALFEAV
jgi:acetyl-CoA C-acetyltransferase